MRPHATRDHAEEVVRKDLQNQEGARLEIDVLRKLSFFANLRGYFDSGVFHSVKAKHTCRICFNSHKGIQTQCKWSPALAYFSARHLEDEGKFQLEVVNAEKDGPNVISSQSLLEAIYSREQKWDEAENVLHEMMETVKRERGIDNIAYPDWALRLSQIHQDQGKTEESEKLRAKYLHEYTSKLGLDDPERVYAATVYTAVCMRRAKLKVSPKIQEGALKIQKTIPGREHPELLRRTVALALSLYDLGRLDEAKAYFQEAVNGQSKSLGEVHLDTTVT